MPGILPMKVIKVGTSAQTRIAQACDRCRSKKIRCDGFRPSCSQCSNVGFECKTSDKLSRRAFPRGYTESLEERVRALESEVRELKDLLDEKDEKIDMLSRVHSHSPRTESRRTSSIKSSTAASQVRERLASDGDDHFKVQQSPFLLQGDNSDSYFMGTSGGRMLVDTLKRRLLEYGRPSSTVNAESFFAPNPVKASAAHATVETVASWSTPPRVVSDQMVNIFFQEWAPLFPILHRPSFLSTYTQSVSGSHPVQDKKALAHLNLVYAISALSNETSRDEVELYERQGLAALSAISMDCSMDHLQSLLLAQLYCIQKADYTRLLHYKSLAVGISQRLGLHLSQKRFALGTLTIETRKKVFWTLYTLDCFTAACLGLPKQIKDQDVECEFPVDADDENVTEKGFQPSLPGEFTKLSSALAQFRCSRILSRVLENNYPTHATHELSVKETWEFNDELQAWYEDLAPHLRLEFKQGKPGTSTISSRCPFLSLCYSYIRMLIHRPAACAKLSENTASVVAVASASKDAVQVLDLIRERGLSFTFAINKNELLTMAGFGLLLQSMDLDSESKVLKDNQKHVAAVVGMLKAGHAPHSTDFEKLASSVVSPNAPKANPSTNGSTELSPLLDSATLSPGKSNGARRTSTNTYGDKRNSGAIQQKTSQPNGKPDQRLNVSTAHIKPSTSPSAMQKPSLHLASALKQSPRDSPSSVFSGAEKARSTRSPSSNNAASSSNSMTTPDTNLDFFTFPSDPVPSPKRSHCQQPDTPDWDYIISALDDNNADSAADDGQVYEWPPVDEILDLTEAQESMVAHRQGRACGSWSPKIWNSLIEVPPSAATSQPPRSVMSLPETSLASSEEFSNVEIASADLVT